MGDTRAVLSKGQQPAGGESRRPPKRIRIIHETNPRKYFGAVFLLEEQGAITIVGAHRYSVFKETLRSVLRESLPLVGRFRRLRSDLTLKAKLPFIKDETVILAIAPWDWRIVYFYHLARRNRVVYQTSWPDWRLRRVPRRYPVIERGLRIVWKRFLSKDSVTPVTIQQASANSMYKELGIQATVLPHAVDDFFFRPPRGGLPKTESAAGLRLLFVGELAEKKGVIQSLDIARALNEHGVHLTVVGDGPLRSVCASAAAQNPNIEYLGSISDREMLASIVSSHDILLVLSRRTDTWEELFGIVIVEALAAGLAVVASDHVGPTEILGSGSEALFDQDDMEAIRRLLIRLSSDPALREGLKTTQGGIAARFHIDNIARDWVKVL